MYGVGIGIRLNFSYSVLSLILFVAACSEDCFFFLAELFFRGSFVGEWFPVLNGSLFPRMQPHLWPFCQSTIYIWKGLFVFPFRCLQSFGFSLLILHVLAILLYFFCCCFCSHLSCQFYFLCVRFANYVICWTINLFFSFCHIFFFHSSLLVFV